MSKYWKIGSRDDALFHYAEAATAAEAVSYIEKVAGPINPSRRMVQEITHEEWIEAGGEQDQ